MPSGGSTQVPSPVPDQTLTSADARPKTDALTGLRFFAALYVVLFHAEWGFTRVPSRLHPLKVFLGHGYLAVSLFFILSGYVLSYNYADRWQQTAFGRFLIARLARIYPVYLLALLLQLPFYWPYASVSKTLSVLFMVQSWTISSSPLPGAWNFPSWTLSIEWFFYLCFPLLLVGMRKLRNRMLPLILVCLISIAVGGVQVSIGGRGSWLSSHVPMPLLRLPEFFLGMLLAQYKPAIQPSGAAKKRLLLFSSLTITFLLLTLNTHRFVTLLVAPFAIILWLLAHQESWLKRFLEQKWLVLLGGASYAVYLLQEPVLSFVALPAGHALGVVATTFVYVPLLVCCSIAVFAGYEQPLRRWIRANA